ncbi:helix-turn-helix transcriptional regulator [Streptomyces sp. FT1]|uniref:helix-turn-helix transcriptional regulator n=1 Tax=Streptomyces sp. FT1 TaxID=2871486 RepID=UPI0022575585|nr:helix-turn-helix transcriptional regulator [Streptomyces sp. FT1]MCX5460140.1 helix-turn-helix transcriptional regulator [Streptomyces sp. FT1]
MDPRRPADTGAYRERPALLTGAALWTRTTPTTPVRPVLPDGCMDLIWARPPGAPGRLLVAGPDTGPHPADAAPGTRYAAVRFAPGTAPALLGVAAHELRDRRTDLADLWPAARVRALAGHLEAADRPARALDDWAARHAADRPAPDPRLLHLVPLLAVGTSVADAAATLGLGPRRLHQLSRETFGYGPKTLARILRLARARELAATGLSAAETAHRAGYADQPHLSREVRALTGLTAGELLRDSPDLP